MKLERMENLELNKHKAKKSSVPSSQLYRQAGNGLVVDVFTAILKTMIKGEQNDK